MITMLSFFLIACDYTDNSLTLDESRGRPVNVSAVSEDASLSRYERYTQKLESYVVKTEVYDVMVSMVGELHPLRINFHMSPASVDNDIDHVVMASERVLRDVVPQVAESLHLEQLVDPLRCINTLRSIELYHVPCAALNDAASFHLIGRDGLAGENEIVLGLTLKKGHSDYTDTFLVSYCYDEMAGRAQKLTYERDHHYREVALAHEIAHVWLGSCMPGAAFIYANRFEKVAQEFDAEYESTAREHHVSYPGVNETQLKINLFLKELVF